MERIDVLGDRPDRHAAFSRELLSEAEDAELDRIVKLAAEQLRTPIALVNLVLDRIQFFKAHHGLPSDLKAVCGTTRDASFCQFVVRDGAPFEVNNAIEDERVPQRLVQDYGLRAYLGVPVMAADTIVGSLCVIDVKPRDFTEEDRGKLKRLGERVTARLEQMETRSDRARRRLTEFATTPALAELRGAVRGVENSLAHARVALATLRAIVPPKVDVEMQDCSRAIREYLDAETLAYEDCDAALTDARMSAQDGTDSLDALEHVLVVSPTARLSEIAVSGRELARHSVARVGVVHLPEPTHNPEIAISRALGVALVASCLGGIAASLEPGSGKIHMDVETAGRHAGIEFHAEGLDQDAAKAIADDLRRHTDEDPTVSAGSDGRKIVLRFATLGDD